MVLEMEKGFIIMMIEINMKEIRKRVRWKEKEYIIIEMEINMMGIGKKTKELEENNIL